MKITQVNIPEGVKNMLKHTMKTTKTYFSEGIKEHTKMHNEKNNLQSIFQNSKGLKGKKEHTQEIYLPGEHGE